jgi:serine/threonine-protein kinase
VIPAACARELDALRRFLQEATSTATVNHPAVVRVLHVDVSGDGMLFQVQELVDGDTLQRRLTERPWDPGVVARIAGVLCEALAAAHAGGVIHRDVKPSNVMLTRAAPGLKLLDFGIAKLREAASFAEVETRTGAVLGTPAYMAPEQIGGATDLGDRLDVYAVGVILFLLLTGRLPFEAESARKMLLAHVLDAPPDPRSLEESVPDDLAALVARCLQKEPEDRPGAAELASALAAFARARNAPKLEELEQAGGVCDAHAAKNEALITVAARRRAPQKETG